MPYIKKEMLPAIIFDIIGALLLGFGLCLCLIWKHYITGAIIIAPGLLIITITYPIYHALSKKREKKS